MAATLTEDKGLVRRLNGVAPIPGHYLVVFKRVKEGRRLHGWYEPGMPFKKPLLESIDSFIAYAVPADGNLRHPFQRSYKSHDLVHSYTLSFTLDYRVADPGTLVEKLDLDPLKRLEDEVHLLLVQKNKTLDWSAVEEEEDDLENVLFHDGMAHRESAPNHELLRRFAATQGFEVKRVVVTRDLPPGEIGVKSKKVETERNLVVLELEHKEKSLSQRLELERQGEENSFGRQEKVQDGFADSIVQVTGQVAGQIHTMDDAQRVLGKMSTMQHTMLNPAVGGTVALSAGTAGMLLPTAPETGSPLQVLLSEVLEKLGHVTCSAEAHHQLLSDVLHVIAEAVRGPEAQEDILNQYAENIRDLRDKLKLKPDQFKLLKRLAKPDELRREVGR
jgi:hypothetical protein